MRYTRYLVCLDIRVVTILIHIRVFYFFFFNDTATTEIYTLSLHDALPICSLRLWPALRQGPILARRCRSWRSEEHTSELQSQFHLVCRLLLEKKKNPTSLLNHIEHIISSSAHFFYCL